MPQYSINHYAISTFLSWVQAKEIAIPEIQRPFVWKTTQVRDLMDSLYKGFPIGYIIDWKNPDVRLKDGTPSSGKKILIDGQQRITALRAAILGEKIIDKDYKEQNIKIAFHPIEEKFETLSSAIEKDSSWIGNISEYMDKNIGIISAVKLYCKLNPNADEDIVGRNIEKLQAISNMQIGVIELAGELNIETVTEIFHRINSRGISLSSADYVMSKIAAYDNIENFGVNLRKCIDYFSHLSKDPSFIKIITDNDIDFNQTPYFSKISWLKNEKEDLYDPDYSDILSVSFTKEFGRGKLNDLVELLSGRNFETRTYEGEIMDESFKKLSESVLDFVNETHFKRFIMIIKSCGFIDKYLIRSQSALNFAYIVYLKLRDDKMDNNLIEKYVRKWFVMSILTSRYSGSTESIFDYDIKRITENGIENYLKAIEEDDLSDTFWNISLVRRLETATVTNPILKLFFATQVKDNNTGFLSSDITVSSLISHRGDVHHIFPKEYLRKKKNDISYYNQVANFAFTQSDINIKIGKKSPNEYFAEIQNQCNGGELVHGGINSINELKKNLEQHCIPESIFGMNIDNYEEFLQERRKLIAKRIEKYYKSFDSEYITEVSETGIPIGDIISAGESHKLEFKSSLRWDVREGIVNKKLEFNITKTISAFLNSNGGTILIGVEDNGNILGIENDYSSLNGKNFDGFLQEIDNLIDSTLGKELHRYIKTSKENIDGKDIAIIKVEKCNKPVFVTFEGKELFFIRAGSSSRPLSHSESLEFVKSNW